MGVIKVTDADGNVGYLETTVNLSSTSPSNPARLIQNRELMTNGAVVSSGNPLQISITNWSNGVMVGPNGGANVGTIPYFSDSTGRNVSASNVYIDQSTGLFSNVGIVGTLSTPVTNTINFSDTSTKNNLDVGSGVVVALNPASGSLSISSLSGGTANRLLVLRNVHASNTITLQNNVTGGSVLAGNSIQVPGNAITLAAGSSATLQYDSDNTVWRVISANYNNCDFTFGRNVTFARYFIFSPYSATSISSDQNNYGPSNYTYIQLTSSQSVNITGLVAISSGGIKILHNVGSYNITLVHNSASSSAANRFSFNNSGNLTILPGEMVQLMYDGNTSLWKLINSSQAGSNRTYTVANLPASTVGSHAHATNGRRSGETANNGTGCPVWYDGTNWRTFYDNSIVQA